VRFAATIEPSLQTYLIRLARDRSLPIAEVNRRVGDRAAASGLHRASYAGVRLLVRAARLEPAEPSWGEVVLDVASRTRPIGALEDKYAGLINKHLPEDHGLRNDRR
jgi:hypothetical protein